MPQHTPETGTPTPPEQEAQANSLAELIAYQMIETNTGMLPEIEHDRLLGLLTLIAAKVLTDFVADADEIAAEVVDESELGGTLSAADLRILVVFSRGLSIQELSALEEDLN